MHRIPEESKASGLIPCFSPLREEGITAAQHYVAVDVLDFCR
jgi:hypothetical protein